MVLDELGRLADGLHPHMLAGVHVDRRDAAVRRLHQRQSKHGRWRQRIGRRVTGTAAGGRCCSRTGASSRAASSSTTGICTRCVVSTAPTTTFAATAPALNVIHAGARRVVHETQTRDGRRRPDIQNVRFRIERAAFPAQTASPVRVHGHCDLLTVIDRERNACVIAEPPHGAAGRVVQERT